MRTSSKAKFEFSWGHVGALSEQKASIGTDVARELSENELKAKFELSRRHVNALNEPKVSLVVDQSRELSENELRALQKQTKEPKTGV